MTRWVEYSRRIVVDAALPARGFCVWAACACVADAARRPPARAARFTGRSSVMAGDSNRSRFADAGASRGRAFDDSGWTAVDVPHTWNRLGNEGTERSPLVERRAGRGLVSPAVQDAASGSGAGVRALLPAVRRRRRHRGCLAERPLSRQACRSVLQISFRCHGRDQSRGRQSAGREGRQQPVRSRDRRTENVIPLSGDFFVFGGIYRNVSLIVTGRCMSICWIMADRELYASCVHRLGSRRRAGVEPSGQRRSQAAATVRSNAASRTPRGQVVLRVGRAERQLRRRPTIADAACGLGQLRSRIARPDIPHPRLWQGTQGSVSLPHASSPSRSPRGAILDRVVQPLGLRTVAFDPDKGFFLNGEHLFLHGASMHQDRPVKGWAISRRRPGAGFRHPARPGRQRGAPGALSTRPTLLRARRRARHRGLGGNPAGEPGVLRRHARRAPSWPPMPRQQLLELIRQNYNHPSIAVWSIANEVDLTATQTKGPSKPRRPAGVAQPPCQERGPEPVHDARRLLRSRTAATTRAATADMRHAMPSSASPTSWATTAISAGTPASSPTSGDARRGACAPSRSCRWPFPNTARARRSPNTAMTPAGGPINPHGRPHPEEYQNLYHEAVLEYPASARLSLGRVHLEPVRFLQRFAQRRRSHGHQRERSGELRPRGRKDAFYFYRANWSPQPTLHLVGRRYTDRAYARARRQGLQQCRASAAVAQRRGSQGVASCSEGICLWRGMHLAPGDERVARDRRHRWSGSERHPAVDVRGIARESCGSRRATFPAMWRGTTSATAPICTSWAARARPICRTSGHRGQAHRRSPAPYPQLYDSFREGDFAYRIPVPDRPLPDHSPIRGADGDVNRRTRL